MGEDRKWQEGDILQSEDGYKVFVVKDNDGSLSGRLLCKFGDSCENIPYSLTGKHTLIHRDSLPNTEQEGKNEEIAKVLALQYERALNENLRETMIQSKKIADEQCQILADKLSLANEENFTLKQAILEAHPDGWFFKTGQLRDANNKPVKNFDYAEAIKWLGKEWGASLMHECKPQESNLRKAIEKCRDLFNDIKSQHMDCDCSEEEHAMFKIADEGNIFCYDTLQATPPPPSIEGLKEVKEALQFISSGNGCGLHQCGLIASNALTILERLV